MVSPLLTVAKKFCCFQVFLTTDHTMETCLFTTCAIELAMIREAVFNSWFEYGRRDWTNKKHCGSRKWDLRRDVCSGAAMANDERTEVEASGQVLRRSKDAESRPCQSEVCPNAWSMIIQRCFHRRRAQSKVWNWRRKTGSV